MANVRAYFRAPLKSRFRGSGETLLLFPGSRTDTRAAVEGLRKFSSDRTAPVLVGSSQATAVASSLTVNRPTGTADGQWMLLAVAYSSSVILNSAPSGWTQILHVQASNPNSLIIYKRQASSEPASYTIGFNTSDGVTASWTTWSGSEGIGAPVSSTSFTTSYSTPSNGMGLESAGLSIVHWGGNALTVPSDVTQITNQNGATNNFVGLFVGYTNPISGWFGNKTFTDGSVQRNTLATIEVLGAAYVAPSGSSYSDAVTESAAATEAETATLTAIGALTESAAATEALTSVLATTGSSVESAAASETQAAQLVTATTLAESSAATDAAVAGLAYASSLTETVTATDASAAALSAVGALTESAAATESQAGLALMAASRAETAAATESAFGNLVAAPSLTESAAANDVFAAVVVMAASIGETIAASDTVQVGAVFVTIAETAATGDSQTAAAVLLGSVSETATAGHSQAALMQAVATRAETAAATDAVTTTAQLGAPLSEAVVAGDAALAGLVGSAGLSDTAVATDAVVAALRLPFALAEILSAADSVSATVIPANFNRPYLVLAGSYAPLGLTGIYGPIFGSGRYLPLNLTGTYEGVT